MKILGIDPGSLNCGLSLLQTDPLEVLDCRSLHFSGKKKFDDRLLLLGQEIEELILTHRPDLFAIEEVFSGINIQSAFKLGQVRGMLLYLAKKNKMRVFQYPAKTVKKAITGSGSSSKLNLQMVLQHELKIDFTGLTEDASDSLAIAYTCFLENFSKLKLSELTTQLD